MVGLGCNTDTLIEIICTRSNKRLGEIKTRYHELYQSDLEKDVQGETGGDLNRLLVSLLQGNRDEGTKVDASKVREDATNL